MNISHYVNMDTFNHTHFYRKNFVLSHDVTEIDGGFGKPN